VGTPDDVRGRARNVPDMGVYVNEYVVAPWGVVNTIDGVTALNPEFAD
jgi:hypothetical protein